jgi:integrase/recombinase XerD
VANRRASIWTYKKVDGKWRYCKPVYGRNHKIVTEKGVAYYIRWREGDKIVWRKCSSAADATVACERQEAYLTAYAHGLTLSQTERGEKTPLMMSDLLLSWLEEYRLSHRPESFKLMEATLNEFHGWNRNNLIERIGRVDLLRYRAWCIESKKNEPRTAANKMLRVNQFIRSVLGLPEGKGPVTVKDAKFTELEPTVYNDDELTEFFKHCDSWRTAIFKTYLMAGLRKAELENLTWDDVDLKAGTVRVSSKPDWQPKTWEERTIEIPDELVAILTELPHRGKTVFANSNGGKYTHSWDDAKAIGEKAKIEDCHPHRFRSTFATRTLQLADLKTVQSLLGHRDIASTMRYLARASSKKTREKVNAIWA